jgi:hypothetical protein
MASSDGLIRKPFISVCFHLFSFNVMFSFDWSLPDLLAGCMMYLWFVARCWTGQSVYARRFSGNPKMDFHLDIPAA